MKKLLLPVLPLFVLIFACQPAPKPGDLIIKNAAVVTVDKNNTTAEAISVSADTIQFIGTNEEIKDYIGDSTKIIDAKGKLVIPGFIDSHAHFMGIGKSKTYLNLKSVNNWDEIIALVAEKAQKAKPGEWILGRGWHQEKWDPPASPAFNGYPYHNVLSSASPRNPVLLFHASGHAVFANEYLMNLAGIDTSTQSPEGGKIVRDSMGIAIGVFEENAEELITTVYDEHIKKLSPDAKKEMFKKQAELASEELISKGITSMHDAGESFKMIDYLKTFVDEKIIAPRLYVMVYEDNTDTLKKYLSDYKIIGYGNNHLTVRSYKRYIDGALGSRGALMLTPYSDLPDHSGLQIISLGELEKQYNIAYDNGFQVCTHAIGDRGNRYVLNLYEKIFHSNNSLNPFRWRIEHAQHLSTSDIPRFAELDVIAAMQGIHCTSDAVFVEKRLGRERARRGAYVWRKLIDTGALICNGTDSPVEDVNPIDNFFASVTRRTKSGVEFFPDQSMTRMEALKSSTINGAYAAFEETEKGSLEVGKLADIIMLSKNILEIPDWDILNARVEVTIIGGQVLYKR